MSTRPRRRPWRAAAVVLVLMLAASCTADPPAQSPGPEARLAEFAAAWQGGDPDAAADLTTAPDDAALLLDEVLGNLRPESVTVTAGAVTRTGADTATTAATLSWVLPDAGTWTYPTTWTWRRDTGDGDWVLEWSPAVVHPKLGERQTLGARSTEAPDGVIVDRNDLQLVAPVQVFSVVLMRDQVPDVAATAAALAPVLAPFDAGITAQSIIDGVAAAEAAATAEPTEPSGEPDPDATASTNPPTSPTSATGPAGGEPVEYTVINLREADYQQVKARLDAIAGLAFPSVVRNLATTRDFARALLAQADPVTDELVTGTPGWRVMIVDTTGGTLETLEDHPPVPGQRVALTLDSTIQLAAETALATTPEPAMMVAMQPSTGEILAVAQNEAANALGLPALTGQYPPGSAFKVVTATAALERGLIAPGRPVDCPATVTLDGRFIRNSGSFALGTVDSTLALAKSCNTTFATLAWQMPGDALTTAASSYGIGLDFVVEGVITLTGKAPVADTSVQRAENGFGQGTVLITPFSGALMAATAAHGEMPTPVLIRGTTTTVDKPPAPRPAQVQQDIRTYMRAVVTDGTATVLNDFDNVFAKTGTAEFVAEDGSLQSHAWNIGYRDDLAYAVLVVGGGDGSRATAIAHGFFKTLLWPADDDPAS